MDLFVTEFIKNIELYFEKPLSWDYTPGETELPNIKTDLDLKMLKLYVQKLEGMSLTPDLILIEKVHILDSFKKYYASYYQTQKDLQFDSIYRTYVSFLNKFFNFISLKFEDQLTVLVIETSESLTEKLKSLTSKTTA